MNVQWYPGHMTKAKRMMQENMGLIDLVIELVDARAPESSRNPDIDTLAKGKARILLLNKADLADPRKNKLWAAYYREKGFYVLELDSKNRSSVKQVSALVREACREKLERDKKRGILNRPLRAMVAGIPNVGKSTFINSFVGKSAAKTGNKPGVTKGKQWIRVSAELELLDTPGILWPKFEDQEVGIRLAQIGSVNDEILQMEELALWLIRFLRKEYPEALAARYGLNESGEAPVAGCRLDESGEATGAGCGLNEGGEALAVMERICKARGCVKKGNEPDYAKASGIIEDDFRSGRLGKVTLEIPPQTS